MGRWAIGQPLSGEEDFRNGAISMNLTHTGLVLLFEKKFVINEINYDTQNQNNEERPEMMRFITEKN